MKKETVEKGVIFVELGKDRKARLRRYCFFNNITVSQLIRDAVDDKLGLSEELDLKGAGGLE